jgi:N-methylhydantoinase B
MSGVGLQAPRDDARSRTLSDPVAAEIITNALTAIAGEMSNTVVRGGYSSSIKEGADASAAILSARGELIADAAGTNLLHAASLREGTRAILDSYPAQSMGEGDVYLMNDPARGGVHSNDIIVVRPVFAEGVLAFFTGTLVHVADLGGVSSGGLPAQATEIYHEGLLLPPVPLYRAGVENEVVCKIIALNSRAPEKVLGDIRALVGGCNVGAERLGALIQRYRPDVLRNVTVELMDYAEQLTRREIVRLPEGPLTGEFVIDDDGVDLSRNYRVKVTITRNGSDLTVDCAGTSEQARGAINASHSQALTGVIYAVRCFIDPFIPMNEGVFRAIHAIFPPGTLVSPGRSAALNARMVTVFAIVEAIRDALADQLPQASAGSAMNHVQMISGRRADTGRAWIVLDNDFGGRGALNGKDGEDCTGIMSGRAALSQIEPLEAEFPLRLERHALIPDSGGAGQWRGGLGVERTFRMLGDAEISVRADRMRVPPTGRLGGLPGRGGGWVVNRGQADERVLPGKLMGVHLAPGDTLTMLTSGGGGFGPPDKRDPDAVRRDVAARRVTLQQARETYGVVLDAAALTVDAAATAALRAERASVRCA